jgi:hypothetical protein
MVGFCAGSILSISANAEQWIVNCESNRCLDATAEGMVQVSDCDKSKTYQGWNANAPKDKNIENNGNKKCLDFDVDEKVVKTNECKDNLDAQKWKFVPTEDGGTIENEVKPGQCLLGEGDLQPVKLVACDANNNSQKWKWVNVDDVRKGCPPK